MIFVYLGMAALLAMNFFEWDSSWNWLRWTFVAVLGAYGLYRGYRQFKGIDYYHIGPREDSTPQRDTRIDDLIQKVREEDEKKNS